MFSACVVYKWLDPIILAWRTVALVLPATQLHFIIIIIWIFITLWIIGLES